LCGLCNSKRDPEKRMIYIYRKMKTLSINRKREELRIERERVLWGGSGRNFIPKMKRMMGET
jgi:hypothetical protein